jgi:flagellar hook protein FlgE
MSTIPAFQSGLAGIQSGMQSLNRNAAKIASADTLQSGGDLTEPLVNMIRDEHQVKASAKVIEASSAMMGTLLDIKV